MIEDTEILQEAYCSFCGEIAECISKFHYYDYRTGCKTRSSVKEYLDNRAGYVEHKVRFNICQKCLVVAITMMKFMGSECET